MRKLAFIFLCYLIFISGYSQSFHLTIQNSGTTRTLWSVYFTDANSGYAVGNKGTIIKTVNGGNSWSSVISGTTNHLYSVFFISNNIGWAVGANCTILKTTNAGTSWSKQVSGINNDHFFSVYFVNENIGFITTQTGAILKTTDSGETWINQSNQSNPFLFSVFFINTSVGFAAGGNGYNGSEPSDMKILKTTDGGSTWTAITTGVKDGVLYSVNFININTGFAVGVKDSGNAVFLKTTDGGITWNEKVLADKTCLRSINFTDENTGYCAGDRGFLFKTTDGGVTWSDISEPTLKHKNPGLYSLYFINPNTGWIMYSDGSVLKYNDLTILTPSLSTTSASAINLTSVTSGGNITSDGGSLITSRGVCWSTSINPTLNDNKTIDGSGTGSFTSSLVELSQGTTYYARAYATNSSGTAYGNQVSFTTLTPVSIPILSTTTVSSITTTTASGGGDITSDGGATITERGICWSTSVNPTTTDSKTTNGSGKGLFTSSMTGLNPNTTYYIRAYATNSAGTAYGNELTFKTLMQITLPILSTSNVSSITSTTASGGGNITSDGGGTITARGVCWSTSANPTITNSKTTNGSGTGSFSSSITGLTANTTYYMRAYATNSAGTAYGNEVNFKTSAASGNTISDVDGNTYKTVVIGTQTWMAENLKSKKYNNGSAIPLITDNVKWLNSTTPGFCWYNNDSATYSNPYGAIYNWYAVNTGLLCPAEWHLPSYAEWFILSSFLGGDSIAGGKLKEIGNTHWTSPNTGATDEVGFMALPAGYRGFNSDGIGHQSSWWSSTDYALPYAYNFDILNNEKNLYSSGNTKSHGFSVRCVKNSIPTITTSAITAVGQNAATGGGNVTSEGGVSVTARGICWSTSANPTISNSKTADGSGAGAFTSSISGLSPNTTYYVRAYATNIIGTSYGNEVNFKTSAASENTISDIDGNTYKTVVIGTQTWMAENLKTTKYRNGDVIGTTNPATLDISSEINPKYQWAFNGLESNVATYGRLYTWFTIDDSRGVCPEAGWHVSTDNDWTILTDYAGGENVAGSKLRETGITHWQTMNYNATDEYGFTALPGALRITDGLFGYGLGERGFWWTSSSDQGNAWSREIYRGDSKVYRNKSNAAIGYSVRCVKNSAPTISSSEITSIGQNSATGGGNITYDGGAAVIARGICWSTSANPTTSNNKTTNGSGTGTFTSSISGLTANTTYYVRAYATNSAGTAYGNQVSFTTTASTASVSDCDGNSYNVVTIGGQTWMAENLKTTKYNDCTSIPLITDNTAWYNTTTPAYCWYKNDQASYKNPYGALYNWYTVNTGKLCPVGWHVPSEIEFRTMITYLIDNGFNYDGTTNGEPWTNNKTGKALASNQGWANSVYSGSIGNSAYPEKRNITGFSALGGGLRSYVGFLFGDIDSCGFWWFSDELSNSDAWHYIMCYTGEYGSNLTDKKSFGLSVRCKKDNPSEILIPSIVTGSWTSINGTSGTCGGNVASDGGAAVTARGVCWSTTTNPTISNNKTTDGSGTGSFTSSLTGLAPNTRYWLRAYSTNSAGTSYGYQIDFTTSSATIPVLSTTSEAQ